MRPKNRFFLYNIDKRFDLLNLPVIWNNGPQLLWSSQDKLDSEFAILIYNIGSCCRGRLCQDYLVVTRCTEIIENHADSRVR